MGFLALAAQAGPLSAAAEDKPESAGEYGTIKGQFLLEGTIPSLTPLVAAGDMNINDPAVCSAADIPDDSLIVDGATQGIADVFVYLPKAEQVHPKRAVSRVKEVDFDQKARRFAPHALIVPTDQVVRVKSEDNCVHNTKTNPARNQAVNFALQANDRTGQEVRNK